MSSLIESCILGVDFLVLHRVALDFSSKRVTGPELGVVNANNNLESSTILWEYRQLAPNLIGQFHFIYFNPC